MHGFKKHPELFKIQPLKGQTPVSREQLFIKSGQHAYLDLSSPEIFSASAPGPANSQQALQGKITSAMKTTHFGYIDVYLHLSLKLQLVPSMKQSLKIHSV